MRAAVLHSIEDSTFDIRDDVEAVGPGPGQVRIRVRASGVCHSDLSARNGGLPQPMPAILGHEAAGDVAAVGDGVTGLAVGDRVIASWLPPCGSCPSCLRGQPYLCMTHVIAAYVEPRFLVGGTPAYGLAGCGAFAEEMVVPQEGAVKIAPDVPYELAALVGCGVVTGVGAVINTARVEPGATVAVIGCGGVGLQAIAGARLAGAARVVAIDRDPGKLERALRLGATDMVLSGDGRDPLERVRELCGDGGADHAIEVVGRPDTIRQAFDMIRPGGTAVVVGIAPKGVEVALPALDFVSDKTIAGCFYGSGNPAAEMPELIGMLMDGRLDVAGVVSDFTDLDGIEAAFERLRRGQGARTVVVLDEDAAGLPEMI
jgi:S-(hydroxymethyl)glutathione dehydrogenase/alcohol dehydrogenase